MRRRFREKFDGTPAKFAGILLGIRSLIRRLHAPDNIPSGRHHRAMDDNDIYIKTD
ncbi:hypothetical protein SBA5_410041 [Candidatus Sulfotelmatomonas gaucii]|uniref:Uncharacterized protein n=1 Tax=Candidatus Sulfuritelmatomonas gaucii TaxID=2043161 RepID=A0A2N9LL51_9BACT|nr:hypothetical protein SBA5_410041 [Candidatus Sulfotelmatomonas gaucii]